MDPQIQFLKRKNWTRIQGNWIKRSGCFYFFFIKRVIANHIKPHAMKHQSSLSFETLSRSCIVPRNLVHKGVQQNKFVSKVTTQLLFSLFLSELASDESMRKIRRKRINWVSHIHFYIYRFIAFDHVVHVSKRCRELRFRVLKNNSAEFHGATDISWCNSAQWIVRQWHSLTRKSFENKLYLL
jgi:hypothetical protein